MHVLVTRPEPEASAMVARLATMGISATSSPLAVVEPCAPARLWDDTPTSQQPRAVVVTSRNALAAIADHADLPSLQRLPVVAVGPGTAAAARALGFAAVIEGPGAASGLPQTITASGLSGPLLVLRGEKVAFDLCPALELQGVATHAVIVYRMRTPVELPQAARRALAAGKLDGVVLMSPETAKVFTVLVQGADLTRALSRITYFCLSPAVAASAAAPASARIMIAEKPNLEEMLAVIAGRAPQSPIDI